jgi:hypothetical protein
MSTTYYVSTSGNDANNGSQSKPWKTPKAVNNATVYLTAGETFLLATPLSFNGLSNAVVTSDPTNPATLQSAAGGAQVLSFWTNSTNITLENVIVDSVDGKGFAGNVYGTNISIVNVLLKNLNEGFDYIGPCINLTITGGAQIGKVSGRCHYLLDVTKINWVGDPTKIFGPASTQSPIRFSSPGVVGGTISGVNVSQVGSTFPIACWAIHAANGVTFENCISNGGEFSFNSAGSGENDKVSGCIIRRLQTIQTKLSLDLIAYDNQIIDCIGSNDTGECISLSTAAKAGNTITGAKLTSPKHGVHFYTVNDSIVKGCTLYTSVAGAPMIDGANSPANDGGGNVVVVGSAKLMGTPIGTAGSYANDGNTMAKVFDGNATTFFDAPTANGNWVGLDLGTPAVITSIIYTPRAGWEARMIGGTFQGSNELTFATSTTLATIAKQPTGATTVAITDTTAFRYVRYLSPAGSYGNIAGMLLMGIS